MDAKQEIIEALGHNHDELKYYHGCLCYEALYCPICGYFADVVGNEGYEEFYKGL